MTVTIVDAVPAAAESMEFRLETGAPVRIARLADGRIIVPRRDWEELVAWIVEVLPEVVRAVRAEMGVRK